MCLVCRSDRDISDDLKRKIGGFCGVPTRAVIPSLDADSIYAVPLILEQEGLCREVLDVLNLADHDSDMAAWEQLVQQPAQPRPVGEGGPGGQVRAAERRLPLGCRSAAACLHCPRCVPRPALGLRRTD